jgi:DNA-binding SARP family transcriptional activator
VVVPVLSSAELEAICDPADLLDRAWALEPPMRTTERTAALDRLERLLKREPPAPAGRVWRLELTAERAVDAARLNELERATELADEVLAEVDAGHEIATVRALMARGRALAWMGTDAASRRADRVFRDVAERCGALGHTEWHGFAIFWRGQTVYVQNGDLRRGGSVMAQALELLGPESAYRSTVLTFYADALAALGEWSAAEAALTEAAEIADRDDDGKTRAYVAWGRAHIASALGDALATERLLREAERDRGDWFGTHVGVTFLAAGAEMLDRVGLGEEALGYLDRATARDPDDEFVRQARATVLARSGDPIEALEALRGLDHGMWLEKRHMWRHTLLSAWATFRAGRDTAGELAARALEQVTAVNGIEAALSAERELVTALAPLAEQTGSAPARQLMLGERELVVRLFGPARVVSADGRVLGLPAGKPGELVRILALHEHGLALEVVLDEFFGEAPPAAARQRLRQILTRLRAAAGELVIRDGEMLRLRPAWVDVREFSALADRVRTTRSSRAIQLAYAALALRTASLLPSDRCAAWAEEIRGQTEYRYLALLDLVAADAAARGAHQEALSALDAALAQDPEDERRCSAVAEQLHALGRHGTALYLAQRTGPEPGDEPAAATGPSARVSAPTRDSTPSPGVDHS